MLLLHLSDLHFGNKNRFAKDDPAKLGKAFCRALTVACQEQKLPGSVALVIVTGDLVESGLPSEFDTAHKFLSSLAQEMKLPPDRFVFLPGNHDICWASCRAVRAAKDGEEFPDHEFESRLHTAKLANYRKFLTQFYGATVDENNLASLDNVHPLGKDGWVRDFPDLKLSVAALNTSEREHDKLKGGHLSEEQALELMGYWLREPAAAYLKILAAHHNPLATTPGNRQWTEEYVVKNAKDSGVTVDAFQHYLNDLAGFTGSEHLSKIVTDACAHLVLHGHHHDQGQPTSWHWKENGHAPVLSVGSFGLEEEHLPLSAPLSCQLLWFLLPPAPDAPQLIAIPLIHDGRLRLKGDLLEGAFRVEPAARSAYKQSLPLPNGWIPAAGTALKVPPVAEPPVPSVSLHQLPPPSDGFVGRESDLETLRKRDHEHGVVLTGLRGMGGIGKTALALVLAHEWAPRYPDAQLFLDGQGLAESPPTAIALMEQVIRAFHPVLGKLPDDPAQAAQIYREVLTGKKVLIFLDNGSGQDQARPLTPPAGCALIVTSRRNFTLGKSAAHPVGKLSEPESVTLLREWYPALLDGDVAALAKLLCGLPLALNIAGAHLAMDSSDRGGKADVASYLKALRSGRLASLDAEAEDAGEIPVSETLRLSEDRLPAEQRQAWRRLGVFAASFDEAAAQAVAGADAEMLRRFVRLSLLEREAERYKLHDLAAEYAREKLAEEELTAAYLAYVSHYTAVGEETDRLYEAGGMNVLLGLQLYDCEQAHLEAAFEWLRPRRDLASANALMALVNSIAYTGQGLRMHPRKRIRWLEAQRDATRLANDRPSESSALNNLGLVYADLGGPRKAIECYEQCLPILREVGNRRSEGSVLNNLGNAYADLGEPRKAIEFYEQRLAIARENDDRRSEGGTLGNLGNVYAALGEPRKAIEFHEQHLSIARETGNRNGEGKALSCLGAAYFNLGEPHKALEFYEQALAIALEIGDRRGENTALWNSALAFDNLGNRAEAVRRAEASLKIHEAIEDPFAPKIRAKLAKWRDEAKSTEGQ